MKTQNSIKIERPLGYNLAAWNSQKLLAQNIKKAYCNKTPWKHHVFIGSKQFFELIKLPNGSLMIDKAVKVKLANNDFINAWLIEIENQVLCLNFDNNVWQQARFLVLNHEAFAVRLIGQLIEKQQFKLAYQLLNTIMDRYNKNAALHHYLAFIYYHWDEDFKALNILNYAITYLDVDFKVFELRSDIFRTQENFTESLSNLQQAINMNPFNANLFEKLASLHEERQEFRLAIQVWNKILAFNMNHSEAHFRLAKIFLRNKKHENLVWKHLFYAKELGHKRAKSLYEKLKQNPNPKEFSKLLVAA